MSQSLFRRRPSRSRRGALIIEAMMAILLFGLFATAAFSGLITGQEGSRVGSDRVRGVFYAERGLEIAKTIRDGSFSTLAQTQDPLTPPHGFSLLCEGDCDPNSPNPADVVNWQLDADDANSTSYDDAGYHTAFTAEDLDVGEAGIRPGIKRIISTTDWQHGYHRPGEIPLTMDLSDWRDFARPIGDWNSASLLNEAKAANGIDSLSSTIQPTRLSLSVDGRHVFAAGDNAFYVFNVEVSPPTCAACSLTFGGAKDIAVYKYKLLVVQNDNTIQMYDINEATNPQPILEMPYTLNNDVQTVFRYGPYLYVGLDDNGPDHELQILDISRLDEIVWVGSADVGESVQDIFVTDQYMYLALGDQTPVTYEVLVYDISDPANPSSHDQNDYDANRATTISGRDNKFYIGYDDTNLRLADEAAGLLEDSGIQTLNAGEALVSLDADPLGCFIFAALDGQDEPDTCPNPPGPPEPCIGDPHIDVQFWSDIQGTPANDDWQYNSAVEDNPLVRDILYNPWKDRVYVSAFDAEGKSHFFVFQPGAPIDPNTCQP